MSEEKATLDPEQQDELAYLTSEIAEALSRDGVGPMAFHNPLAGEPYPGSGQKDPGSEGG